MGPVRNGFSPPRGSSFFYFCHGRIYGVAGTINGPSEICLIYRRQRGVVLPPTADGLPRLQNPFVGEKMDQTQMHSAQTNCYHVKQRTPRTLLGSKVQGALCGPKGIPPTSRCGLVFSAQTNPLFRELIASNLMYSAVFCRVHRAMNASRP